MKKREKIVWIDDNPDRQSTAKDLGANFVNVKGEDLALELNKVLEGPPPQLVIIDHVLDKVGANKHRILLKGSTIAEGLKEKWPACAVVGVTNADNLKGIDIRTEGTYDELFPFQDFKKYIDRINGIADGFALLAKKQLTQRALVKALTYMIDQSSKTNWRPFPTPRQASLSAFVLDAPLHVCVWP